MKKLLLASTVILNITAQSLAHDSHRESSLPTIWQACRGVFTLDDEGYKLGPDSNSKSPWCDSLIADNVGGHNILKQVLDKCTLGKRCYIEGTFKGHGVFYWTKIKLVKSL